MRILHLLPHLSQGGAERQFGYLAPELVRMGHDVHVAYSTDGPCRPELPGVKLHRLESESNYDPYLLWQLIRLVRSIKPDIIQTWLLQMDILGGIVMRIAGVPWVFREPSSVMAYLPTWKTQLRVRVGSVASAIVSNSLGGDDYWRAQLPYSRRYVIPNGLPVDEIDKSEAVLPPGFSIPTQPYILYVGRLIELKNLRKLLQAVSQIKKAQELSVVLSGEGPQHSELVDLTHQMRLDAEVRFTGHLPADLVWALMKKASMFVSLSDYEGCPNTVMEAMACACPLVLSAIPAHREILDESCALFVNPSNIAQVADVIAEVLKDAPGASRRALMARQKAQKWSVAEMARAYEKVYFEIVYPALNLVGKEYHPSVVQSGGE